MPHAPRQERGAMTSPEPMAGEWGFRLQEQHGYPIADSRKLINVSRETHTEVRRHGGRIRTGASTNDTFRSIARSNDAERRQTDVCRLKPPVK